MRAIDKWPSLSATIWWTITTGAGLAIMVLGGAAIGAVSGGGYVGGMLGVLLGGGEYNAGAPIGSGYIGGVLGGALGALIGGLVTGAGQWFVQRDRGIPPGQWVAATLAGFALGGALTAGGYTGATLGRLMGEELSSTLGIGLHLPVRLTEALGWNISLMIFGGLVGTSQWTVLRRYASSARRWIPGTALSWGVGWIIGYPLSKAIGPRLGSLLHDRMDWSVSVAIGETMGWLVGWAAVGAITGTMLLSSLSRARVGQPTDQDLIRAYQ